MRTDKKIDYLSERIADDEVLLRLLCSPLYYDETTGQVNVDAFDLRMMGRTQDQPEHFASVGRDSKFKDDEERQHYIQLGYSIWNDKDWESNTYYGYGTFVAGEARAINNRIELWPLQNSAPYHIGLFYAASCDEYFKGPLPKEDPEILAMLSDLAELIEKTIQKVPKPMQPQ